VVIAHDEVDSVLVCPIQLTRQFRSFAYAVLTPPDFQMYTLKPVAVSAYKLVAPVVAQWLEFPLIDVKYFGVSVNPQDEVSISVIM